VIYKLTNSQTKNYYNRAITVKIIVGGLKHSACTLS